MKKERFEQVKEHAGSHFEGEQRNRVMERMDTEYRLLCQNYDEQFSLMQHHCHNNIYPVVATMRALLAEGMEREQAVQLAGDWFLELMEDIARSIRKMLKIPGLYRLMPRLWKTMMPKLFSPKSGFRFEMYPTDSREVRFDILECPYYQICRELDCTDLAPVFCATDDTCYGNMHPKLQWKRTQTIARGGQLCDFYVGVKK